MSEQYDSAPDTLAHIDTVRNYLQDEIEALEHRGMVHDASKLQQPEKDYFDKYTPMLKELEYGTEEYKESLRLMKVGIHHHYQHNSHHPEHFSNGIAGMDILDVVEMLCDWKAASERTLNGDMSKGLPLNKERFGIDDQLYSIIYNSAKNRGWI